MNEFQKLVTLILKKPHIFNYDSYKEICAFIEGYNFGKDRKELDCFSEMLVLKFDGGRFIHWPKLSLLIIFGEGSKKIEMVETDTKILKEALNGLQNLFGEFFANALSESWKKSIRESYGKWLQNRSKE